MAPENLPHRFIVIEGPIGVGKTTLAAKLASTLSAELILERADENPFLERFYRNPRAGALPAQLHFLFQRAQQLAALKQHEQFIDRGYLERLNDAYARFFHEYDSAPLLIVNAATIDPVNTDEDYEELLAAIRRLRRGRLYYNPMRHAAL